MIISGNKEKWIAPGSKGSTRFIMQNDGNFVAYAGNNPLWDIWNKGKNFVKA